MFCLQVCVSLIWISYFPLYDIKRQKKSTLTVLKELYCKPTAWRCYILVSAELKWLQSGAHWAITIHCISLHYLNSLHITSINRINLDPHLCCAVWRQKPCVFGYTEECEWPRHTLFVTFDSSHTAVQIRMFSLALPNKHQTTNHTTWQTYNYCRSNCFLIGKLVLTKSRVGLSECMELLCPNSQRLHAEALLLLVLPQKSTVSSDLSASALYG